MFYHSLVSDWNHGNAHFLRGVVRELIARGHEVDVYEPRNGWSLTNLLRDEGQQAIDLFFEQYPDLASHFYDPVTLDLDVVLADADAVLVHEWNDPLLVSRIGQHHRRSDSYLLLFHDTHHRSFTDPKAIVQYDLSEYDGVLAFGRLIRDRYLENGWARQAWTWHEAADTTVFHPMAADEIDGQLTWIGNWGDEERSNELRDFLIEPVKRLELEANVYGVRYPDEALSALATAGIHYGGCLPNFFVPLEFARHRVTVHIPRRVYREQLHGIPTIRVFEALACGIPLVSVAWEDVEGLFHPGDDYLVAETPAQMTRHLQDVLNDTSRARHLSEHGRATINEKHTCGHRVNELLAICTELGAKELQPAAIRRA
jgi:spore maturation protein CgeB